MTGSKPPSEKLIHITFCSWTETRSQWSGSISTRLGSRRWAFRQARRTQAPTRKSSSWSSSSSAKPRSCTTSNPPSGTASSGPSTPTRCSTPTPQRPTKQDTASSASSCASTQSTGSAGASGCTGRRPARHDPHRSAQQVDADDRALSRAHARAAARRVGPTPLEAAEDVLNPLVEWIDEVAPASKAQYPTPWSTERQVARLVDQLWLSTCLQDEFAALVRGHGV